MDLANTNIKLGHLVGATITIVGAIIIPVGIAIFTFAGSFAELNNRVENAEMRVTKVEQTQKETEQKLNNYGIQILQDNQKMKTDIEYIKQSIQEIKTKK